MPFENSIFVGKRGIGMKISFTLYSISASILSAVVIALIWTIWYAIKGSVPETRFIKISEHFVINFPLHISFWWTVLTGLIVTPILIMLSTSKEMETKDSAGTLTIGLIIGLFLNLGAIASPVLCPVLIIGLFTGFLIGTTFEHTSGHNSCRASILIAIIGVTMISSMLTGPIIGIIIGTSVSLGTIGGIGLIKTLHATCDFIARLLNL